MNDPVKTFLQGVTAAYQRAPIEIVLIIALIVAFVTTAVIYAVVERRRHIHRAESESEALFRRRVAALDLAPSQVAVLRAMIEYMPRPKEPHKLLEDETLFDRYLKRAYGSGHPADDTVAVLRLACGFRSRGLARGIRSTAHLSEGTAVFLRTPGRGGRRQLQGIVERVARQGVLVRVHGGEEQLNRGHGFASQAAGSAVQMLLHHGRGILSVKTTVLRSGRRRLLLQHREGLEASQRRNHFRARAAVPVSLFLDGTAVARGTTADVGGGGFSATFAALDSVGNGHEAAVVPAEGHRTAFSLGLSPAVHGVARVATLEEGGLVRFEFAKIAEADRDRIYRQLFQRVESRRGEREGR